MVVTSATGCAKLGGSITDGFRAMALRFLVVEGNNAKGRGIRQRAYGMTPAQSYAAVLGAVEPDAVCDIAHVADEGFNRPDISELEGYDGVVLTGSALHVYHGGAEIDQQIDLMKAVYRSRTPAFGSCWGLQIGAAAAGGTVVKNPVMREIGFARSIQVNGHGASHPLLAGRPAVFDAPAVHLDIVGALPADCTVLASNDLTPVQAAEIRHDGGVFWGVQYHPEFSLAELASILGNLGTIMHEEGFFRTEEEHARYVSDLYALHEDRGRMDLAWRFGLDRQVLDTDTRLTEIRNFINLRVKPAKSARGRA
jgi:GMP synthase (glutamine-hydrolysing)